MMEQNFSHRSHQLEMMDGDTIGFGNFRNCPQDLEASITAPIEDADDHSRHDLRLYRRGSNQPNPHHAPRW